MTSREPHTPGGGDDHSPSASPDMFSEPWTTENGPAGAPMGETGNLLEEASQAALEALIESGWDAGAIDEHLRPAAARVMGMLGGLDALAASSSNLVERTLSRISRDAHVSLSPDDIAAADAWVESGYQIEHVPAALRARALRHESLSVLLQASTAGASSGRPGELADRTARLAGMMASVDEDALAPIPISRGAWLQRRMWDVISAAAMLLVAASIMWPVLAGLRQRGMEMACNSNLQSVASAMSAYAGEHHDAMPVVVASLGPQRWWDVNASKPSANSSNLFTLAKNGYTKLASFACPGNPRAVRSECDPTASDWRSLDEISYSYQLMFGKQKRLWNEPGRRVVLADRSPAVLRAIAGERPNPLENSPNHHRAGQHALYSDGSTGWLDTPCIDSEGGSGRDCIWLPRPRQILFGASLEQRGDEFTLTLTGREVPADGTDVFLGP